MKYAKGFLAWCLMLAALLAAVSAPVHAAGDDWQDEEEVYSSHISYILPRAGANLSWKLDSSGTLTVSGSGKMYDFGPDDADNTRLPPWWEKKTKIKKAVIQKGVTSVGAEAFADCPNLTAAVIPSGIKTIGDIAFARCVNLSSITIPDGVTTIGAAAFYDCPKLTALTVPSSVTKIGHTALGYYSYSSGGATLEGKVKKLVIKGYTGSAAQQYAKKNGLTFQAIQKTLSTPKLSQAESVNGGVKLVWGKVTGASMYRVFYKTGKGTWQRIGNTSATSLVWKGAASGVKYTFTVRCVSLDGKSYTSGYDTAGKCLTYVAAPVLIKAQNTGKGIQISWKQSAGAVKYRVYRKSGSGTWQRIGDTTKLTFTDAGGKKGVAYTYTVRCISQNASSFTSGYNAAGLTVTRK